MLARYLLVSTLVHIVSSLECFTCYNARNVSECHVTLPCHANEQCSMTMKKDVNGTLFDLGCKSSNDCDQSSAGPAIVGRAVDLNGTNNVCDECCIANYCNKKLCVKGAHGNCYDDPNYNCEMIGGVFDICHDIHHAKTVCKRWCGLCELTDGNWSSWAAWSQCSVTCGQGSTSRARSCTNPSPAHGGLDCVGNATEVADCNLRDCPVHGGWSGWLSWNDCSVSCGVGVRSRDRSCNNPLPGPEGLNCFGSPQNVDICTPKVCTDGNWSTWKSWSTCSASCDVGLNTRERTCDNSSPSTFGKQCIGNSIESELCNKQSCNDNAAGNGTFSEPIIFFSASNPSPVLVNGAVIFNRIVGNTGNAYNEQTGVFTCNIAGLYHFFLSFLSSSGGSTVWCYITKNNQDTVFGVAYKGSETGTASTYLVLSKGDKVKISSCNDWAHVEENRNGMFTGALIVPNYS